MQLDTTAFIRLDAPNSLGATASGAAFATNTGDIFEVACFGPGTFRLLPSVLPLGDSSLG